MFKFKTMPPNQGTCVCYTADCTSSQSGTDVGWNIWYTRCYIYDYSVGPITISQKSLYETHLEANYQTEFHIKDTDPGVPYIEFPFIEAKISSGSLVTDDSVTINASNMKMQ